MLNDKHGASQLSENGSLSRDLSWQRFMRRSEAAIWLAVLLVVVIPTLNWLVPGLWRGPVAQAAGLAGPESATQGAALAGWALAMVPLGILAYGLAQVAVFLRRVRNGKSFTREAADCIWRLGLALLVAAVLLPVARVLAVKLLDVRPSGQAAGGLLAPGALIFALAAVGLGMLVVAKVLRRAVALAEENSRFV